MNSFESICQAEVRRGWFPQLSRRREDWMCEMTGGDWPPYVPRPVGYGVTAEAALTDAIRRRQTEKAA